MYIPRHLTPYLFLLPALGVFGLTVFWPVAHAFYLSFTQYNLIDAPQWIGLANFQRLWTDAAFQTPLRNTLIYLIVVVPLLVILPLVLAILVNQKLRLISWFRASFYTPVVISMVVAGIAWRWLYAENGLFNQILRNVGFEHGIEWLTSPDLAIFSIMAVTVWKGLGYYMVIYLAGLQSIPPELYEAAAIDGCDGYWKHWHITLPLMHPYLLLVAVISAISATKVFEEVYIMNKGGGSGGSSKTVVYYLYDQAFNNLEISYACTIGLVLFFAILGLSIVNLQLSKFRDRLG